MKHINNLNDLQTYGVNLLTGEADRLSFRILCDLNEAGEKLVCDFFGMYFPTHFAENWNSQVNGSPAVGSIMLSADTLWELARFALMTVGNYDCVIGGTGFLCAMNYDEEYAKYHIDRADKGHGRIYRNYAKSSTAPGSGSRNQHAFTGRIE